MTPKHKNRRYVNMISLVMAVGTACAADTGEEPGPDDVESVEQDIRDESKNCSNHSINPHSAWAGVGLDSYRTVREITAQQKRALKNRTVRLQAGTHGGDLWGWAEIHGPTKGPDQVWLDYSNNSGRDWVRCGPYRVDVAGTVGWSRAEEATSTKERMFRACGNVDGVTACTGWW